MSRCKNDVFMNKVGVNKLSKSMEVDFTVYTDLPDCARINANNYIQASTATFNRFEIPDNMLECNRQGCINTGTLRFSGTTGNASYQYHADTVKLFEVLTFYVTDAMLQGGTVEISSDSDFANADKYDYTAAGRGVQPILVDLTKAPDRVEGNGWTPTEYTYIRITVNGQGAGLSSIALFESLEAFESSDVVKIGCLTSIDGSWELEAAEETCFASNEYDLSELNGFEKTITGKALTENYMRLHPLAGRGESTESFDIDTLKMTIAEGGEFGKIELQDFVVDECGFLSIGMADACKGGMLKRLVMPSIVDLDDEHYITVENEGGGVTIYFNKILAGQDVIVSYPKRVQVEEWVFDESNAGTTHVRMSYTKTQTDGTKWRFVFDNVMITSFPAAVTDEETEFEFTVSIRKDGNGRFGRAYKII